MVSFVKNLKRKPLHLTTVKWLETRRSINRTNNTEPLSWVPTAHEDCRLLISVANMRRTFKRVNPRNTAVSSEHGQTSWLECLWTFSISTIPVYHPHLLKNGEHCSSTQASQGNWTKWLSPCSTHFSTILNTVDPLIMCIPPQQIHGQCNSPLTAHRPIPPGQEDYLCENAVNWLQLSFWNHSALQACH